ncbi:MAG: hypothetical protein LC722_00380 [Actinobacteria bacterium]|nr:hypothetical protein [Actinomycetota bacterium]
MSGRERTMLMVLGGVAVLALLVFVLKPFGGDEEPIEEPTSRPPIGVVTPEPSVSALPKLPPLAIFGGRDPFFPLIVPVPLDTGGTTSPGTGGTSTPPVSPPTSPSPGGTNVGDHNIRVLDVFIRDGVQFVQVEVDGKVFTVKEGETFAGNFRVVSIDGQCATFLFGDEQFTECEPGAKK